MASATITKVKAKAKVGPQDHGRAMSLAEFAVAEGQPGFLYELARGVIQVMPIPNLPHGRKIQEIRRQLMAYWIEHTGVIQYMAGGAECGLRLPGMQTERHPDESVYLTPPPDDENPWDDWVPDIVIEVLSKGREARRRDYEEKREEYLVAGVREYWIIDPQRRVMVVLKRRGDVWREQTVSGTGTYRTNLLPGFVLKLQPVFGSVKA